MRAATKLRQADGADLDHQVAENKRRASSMMGGFALVVSLVISLPAALLGAGALGVLLALVVAGALVGTAYMKSESLVVSGVRSRPADPVAQARLHNLVEGLCVTIGLPKPAVCVVEDTAPNAFAAGRGPRNATIVVTTGLLTKLNRIELEGVLAGELSHVRNHDILPATLAVTLIGPVARVLPAPAASALVEKAVGSRRHTVADLSAVSFTRYPPGLIAALGKLRDEDTAVGSATHANAHLWLAPALAGHVEPAPPLEERIAALQEL